MSYTISWNTNISSVIDAMPFGLSKNVSFQVTSSNAIQQTVSTISGSGWTQLSTGSLNNVAVIALFNDNSVNSASALVVATGSTGGNILATLQPGQTAVIPWSGSIGGLYTQVIGTSLYPLTSQLASIQYYLQQG
jgi:hypothetical protein